MTRLENAIVLASGAVGRCNYGGNSRHAGFDTVQTRTPRIRRAFARKQPLCPSVRRSPLWKEVLTEIPAGCGPQKASASTRHRSRRVGTRARRSLLYHKLLLLAADQSRNRIINARMPINSGRQFVRGGEERGQEVRAVYLAIDRLKLPPQPSPSPTYIFNYFQLDGFNIGRLNFFPFV